jgi:hypothetical protein
MNGFHYAEVYYFFQLESIQSCPTFALVSKYSDPNAFLLEKSFGAVWAAHYLGQDGLCIIDLTSIVASVGMIPHNFYIPDAPVQMLYFALEKFGAEIDAMDNTLQNDADQDDQDEQEDREDQGDTFTPVNDVVDLEQST